MTLLAHRFRVPLPADEVWEVLIDLPSIAHCVPGARLDSAVHGGQEGGISTRLGPTGTEYLCRAHFVERDEVVHRAVIEARARETKGPGTASVLATFALRSDGQGTEVTVSAELAVRGTAAQFGPSHRAEASTSMLDTFVRNLEATMSAAGAQSGEAAGRRPASVREAVGRADDVRLDVLRTVLGHLARRSTSFLVGAAFGLLAGIVLGLAGRGGRNRSHERSVLAVPKPG